MLKLKIKTKKSAPISRSTSSTVYALLTLSNIASYSHPRRLDEQLILYF